MNKIAPDKWKHFFVGLSLGVFLQAIGLWALPGHAVAVTLSALSVVLVISYGFELYSKFSGHGHYEVLDAIAAIAGGVLGIALSLAGYFIL